MLYAVYYNGDKHFVYVVVTPTPDDAVAAFLREHTCFPLDPARYEARPIALREVLPRRGSNMRTVLDTYAGETITYKDAIAVVAHCGNGHGGYSSGAQDAGRKAVYELRNRGLARIDKSVTPHKITIVDPATIE